MKTSDVGLAALIGVLALSLAAEAAAVPETIAYQGMLRSDGGAAISGMRSIEFKIYDDPTTGAVLWSETQSVAVVDGRFNVILGAVNPVSCPASASRFSRPRSASNRRISTANRPDLTLFADDRSRFASVCRRNPGFCRTPGAPVPAVVSILAQIGAA